MRRSLQEAVLPVLFSLLAWSCASSPYQSRALTLTPANDLAVHTGAIHATSTPLSPRRGTVTMKAADGENFFGTYAPLATPSEQSWEVILTGDRGTDMRCQYQLDSNGRQGTGRCKMSTGAVYDLSF